MKEPIIIQSFDSQVVKTIKVDTLFGSINVYGHARESIDVELYWDAWRFNTSKEHLQKELEQYNFKIEQEGDTLFLSSSVEGEKTDLLNTLNTKIKFFNLSFVIYVPEKTFLETHLVTQGGQIYLNNVKGKHYVNTKAGTIDILNVKGDVKGKTALGTIDVRGCQGKMDLSSMAGTIEVVDSEGDMIFDTSAGTIELYNLVGHIAANTSAGTIDTNNITGTLNISSAAGSIDVKAMHGGISGRTGSGTIDAEILTLGDYVDLTSEMGSITVRMPFTEGVNLDLEGNRVKGARFNDFEGIADRKRVVGKANGGGIDVHVRSRMGSVRLKTPKGSFHNFSQSFKDPQFTLPSNFFARNTEGVLLSLAICIILTYGLSSIVYFSTEMFNKANQAREVDIGILLSNVLNGITVMVVTFIFTQYLADKIKKTAAKYGALIGLILVFCFLAQTILYLTYWQNIDDSVYRREPNMRGSSFLFTLIPPIVACVYFFFWQRSRQITRKISDQEFQLVNLEKLKTKAELDALQARINPHFLYNSLNSIAGLVHHDPDKAEQMTLLLSKLFRYTIGTKDQHFNTIQDELEIVKTYLDIEQVRFGDRLKYSVFVEKDIENALIPRFLLQPIVENAIKHGISKMAEKGLIEVKIDKNDTHMQLSVHDNGPPFSDTFFTGYGLQSIQDKLKLLYGDKATFDIQNKDYKQVIIQIPC
jgi:two-component system, LytTR family, sensor kinase